MAKAKKTQTAPTATKNIDPKVQSRLDDALGQVINNWLAENRDEHPTLAKHLRRTLESATVNPIAEELKKDAAYHALVERTNAETNIANIIEGLAPIVGGIIKTLV